MTVVDTAQRQPGQSFMLLTESTRMQQRNEMECLPFFANLAMLPDSQLDHLRDTGLLTKTDDTLFVCLLTGKHIEYLEQTAAVLGFSTGVCMPVICWGMKLLTKMPTQSCRL
jgi:hypothetical protein